MFLVISYTFPIYKQLSTQGTITSCSLNKLDVKNHWVLRDLENPQALSSALAALRRYSPGPSSFLNPVEPWFLTSNYYLIQNSQAVKKVRGPQKGYGEKRCEIQGGGQEMAVMVG